MKQQKVQDRGAWIGLYRKADNMFYWIDDTPLAGHYYAWADGEPSNRNLNEEICVQMYTLTPWPTRREGEWDDFRCNLSGEIYNSIAPVALFQKKYI